MAIRLDDDARRYLAAFEAVTGASARDCVVLEPDRDGDGATESEPRLLLVVPPAQMADAIGTGGESVRRFEKRIGATVRLIEDADDPEAFVANAFAPAAVRNVTISENDDTVAYVEVAEADRGLAIGTGGRTIDAARTLAARHHGIDDVQLV